MRHKSSEDGPTKRRPLKIALVLYVVAMLASFGIAFALTVKVRAADVRGALGLSVLCFGAGAGG